MGEVDDVKIFQVLIEIRDGIRQLIQIASRGNQPPPPQAVPTSQPPPGTRSPREVPCPFCKVTSGQNCSTDPNELPLRFQGTGSTTTRAA